MIELRNSSVFAFFMINALFVLIVFLLQLHKDDIHVKWPLGVKTNITYDEATQEVILPDRPAISNPIFFLPIFFSCTHSKTNKKTETKQTEM